MNSVPFSPAPYDRDGALVQRFRASLCVFRDKGKLCELCTVRRTERAGAPRQGSSVITDTDRTQYSVTSWLAERLTCDRGGGVQRGRESPRAQEGPGGRRED